MVCWDHNRRHRGFHGSPPTASEGLMVRDPAQSHHSQPCGLSHTSTSTRFGGRPRPVSPKPSPRVWFIALVVPLYLSWALVRERMRPTRHRFPLTMGRSHGTGELPLLPTERLFLSQRGDGWRDNHTQEIPPSLTAALRT